MVGIPVEVIAILFFLAPFTLLLLRKGFSETGLQTLGAIYLFCGVVAPLLDTRGRMLVSGLGVFLFLIFLPAWLWKMGQENRRDHALWMGAGLALAAAFSVYVRNPYYDYRRLVDHLPILEAVLALFGAYLLWGASRPLDTDFPIEKVTENDTELESSFIRTAGLAIGLISAWGMFYFAFASPNVIARWLGANFQRFSVELPPGGLGGVLPWGHDIYVGVFAGVGLALVVGASLLLSARFWKMLTLAVLYIWNSVFVLSLTAALFAQQMDFPQDPAAFPITEATAPVWGLAALGIAILSSPILLFNTQLFIAALLRLRPSFRTLAGSFGLAALFLLLVILMHVFTTVYDYIPLVGPWLRDRFWLVYAILGMGMAMAALAVPREDQKPIGELVWLPEVIFRQTVGQYLISVIFLFALFFTATGYVNQRFAASGPMLADLPEAGSLTIATFNIQQGYSGGDHPVKDLHQQSALLASLGAQVVGLQESDSNRIANGNLDLVRYFTEDLGMVSYYGPSVATGTFGVALLSKSPILNPRTFYMFSQGEQTACIQAQIQVGERVFNIFVIHLGNDGPMIQLQQVLQEVKDQENVILMGDFNFRTDSEQYHLATQMLADAWLEKWKGGLDEQGLSWDDRIDYVFISPGISVLDARYLTGDQSDHPALVIQIGW
ncbi:MAG: endonuclease/exonuclease/phosphatase family protein [Anaerolineales bacterium]|nr:endonuclease/exonuclease/phosphatase family protein [Anaerolineales bacterium]